MLKKIANHLIYSQFLIALCSVCLSAQTYLLINNKVIIFDSLLLLIFCATMMGYLLPRIYAISNYTKPLTKWQVFLLEREKWLKGLLISLFLSCCFLFFLQKWQVQLVLFFCGLLTIAYSLPLFQWKGERIKLRNMGISKIFLISFVWMVSTVFLPILQAEKSIFPPYVLAMCLERFLFIFVITLPFDIRDMRYDQARKLTTIPLYLGMEKSRKLCYIILFFLTIITGFNYLWLAEYVQIKAYVGLLISYISTAYVISRIKTQLPDQFYTGFLDSTMLIQFLLVYYFMT